VRTLPASLRPIAAVIGLPRALLLATSWPSYQAGGGKRVSVYVPAGMLDRDHRLVQLLGSTAAQRLAKAFPGEILQLPAIGGRLGLAARRAAILEDHQRGIPVREIARLAGITERSVRRIVSGHNA
jgi:hypothetical protein